MRQKRGVTLIGVLTLVILAAVGGWLAGTLIQSPAEAAARTAAPTPSPILAPLEERVLSSNIVTRGLARYGLPQGVSLAPSGLKDAAGVITTVPSRGVQIAEGDVLLSASGRPVFVFLGQTPVFRDLAPGAEGQDVQQLEEALGRLGFAPGDQDGLFDADTSAAVADWYAAAGWPPFEPTAEQRARLRALEDELALAQDALAAAQDELAAAPLAVEAARRAAALNAAQAAAAADDDNAAWAEMAAAATKLQGETAVQAALNAQKAAARAVSRLEAQVTRLQEEVAMVRLVTDVQFPADELIFLPGLPVRIEQVSAAVGDPAQGALLTVTNNQLSIDSSLPLDEAPLVQPGMAVQIDERELGIEATGVVARVADAPGTDGADGFHIYFETHVDATDVKLEGFSLRLTIPVQSTGRAVVVAPISALTMSADGVSHIQVDRNGALEPVAVEPGLAAEGFVEITPLDGVLSAGQLVLIGVENGAE
ncbi:MAG: peptidoglycan-binding protein [Caldilineaceae bacterium]